MQGNFNVDYTTVIWYNKDVDLIDTSQIVPQSEIDNEITKSACRNDTRKFFLVFSIFFEKPLDIRVNTCYNICRK